MTIASLLCVIAGFAGNIVADDITMKPGETEVLNISLASSVSGIYGIQFEINLPEGFSLEKGSNDKIYEMSANQVDDIICSDLDLGGGSYRFVIYSSSLQELKGGNLMSLNLKVDAAKILGSYAVTINNIALSDYEGQVTNGDGISVGVKVTNFFTLLYKVDGEDYKSYEIEYGASITPEAEPTKEGYTFSGWSEIPETMPANDVTITGTFTINKYKLIYYVDGEEYKSFELDYGTSITPEAEPTKEGYTFSGWSEIPETMPAHDVTITGSFNKGEYKLIYMVDGEVYKTVSYDYGASITPEPAPTKEGYTFSGWSEIPETMPANDVMVTGTFTINKYKLTYYVDGEEYKSFELDYGTNITPEAEPTKEGYIFSGWREIPKTMPANDLTVTGKFTINKYILTYIVDGEEYTSYELEYGTSITPEVEPMKEGYTFSGWGEIPERMPAHDVTVTGTFSINSYKLTYMIDNKVYKETMYEYGAIITPEPQPEGNYSTFEWKDLPKTMPAYDVVVYASYTSGIIEVVMTMQCNNRIYSPNGKKQDKLQKGLNIVILDDGSVRKVVVK